MPRSAPAPTVPGVSSYAVVWRTEGAFPLPGQLEVTEDALRLRGRNSRTEQRLVVPYDEILALGRGSEIRIGRKNRAITLWSCTVGELLITAVGGVSRLDEIFTAVQQALTG